MRVAIFVVIALFSCPAHAEWKGFKKTRVDEHVWDVRYADHGFSNRLKATSRLRCRTADFGLKMGYSYMHLGPIVTDGEWPNLPAANVTVTFAHEPLEESQRKIAAMKDLWDC